MHRYAIVFLACVAACLPWPLPAQPSREDASAVLDASFRAMGGEALLRSIDRVELQANARRQLLEQSIRPEGPWISDMYRLQATLDFGGARLRSRETRAGSLGWLAPPARPTPPLEVIVADGLAVKRAGDALQPWSQSAVQDADELLAFNPLRLLLTAAAADDLHVAADAVRHAVAQHVLAWTWRGSDVRVYLAAGSGLPSAVAWTAPRPRDTFWNAWGDIDSVLAFENWSLRPNGLRVPTQWNLERNGLPERSLEIDALVLNPAVDEAAWRIPDALRTQLAALPRSVDALPFGSRDPAVELAPGIVKVPGRWDVAFVRQDDGIVLIEAPIGNGYTAHALDEAARRFPTLPVKAVVSTSDAWPHLAGLREAVARGIPVYVLDLNRPLVERLLAAPHRRLPDGLQRAPRAADLRTVSMRTAIGEGDNRIELLPLRSATGERQMLAWMPGRRLVYTSDLVQLMQDGGWYAPEMLLELQQTFDRLGIAPERCFGMHYGMTSWQAMRDSLDAYLAPANAMTGDAKK